MRVERFNVEVEGVQVVGVLHLPASGRVACVVACHGMGACKDSDKYLLLGREFPEAGLALAPRHARDRGELEEFVLDPLRLDHAGSVGR